MDIETKIRLARPGEASALSALEYRAVELFRSTGLLAEDDYVPSADHPEEIAADILRDMVLVAAEAETDRPMGFAQLQDRRPRLYLRELSVDPSHGRKGLGRMLIEATCARARDEGFRSVSLRTFAEVPWNAPFYSRCGFIEVAASEDWQKEIAARDRVHFGAAAPRIFMERTLD